MKVRIWLAALFVAIFVIVGCSPDTDPRNIADGYATQHEADRLDAKNQYALDQKAIIDRISNTEKQSRLDIFLDLKNGLIVASQWTIGLLTVVVIPTVGLYIWNTGKTASVATQRMAFALAAKVEMEATLIRLDRITRTFPVQLKEIDGHIYVINHNTERKFLLSGSEDIPANAQMVAAFSQAVTSGVLAMEARKSKGKAGSASHFGAIAPDLISLSDMTGELVSMEAN